MEDCHSVKLSRLLALTVLVLNGSLFRNLTLVSVCYWASRSVLFFSSALSRLWPWVSNSCMYNTTSVRERGKNNTERNREPFNTSTVKANNLLSFTEWQSSMQSHSIDLPIVTIPDKNTNLNISVSWGCFQFRLPFVIQMTVVSAKSVLQKLTYKLIKFLIWKYFFDTL